jgi:hypothetical protein
VLHTLTLSVVIVLDDEERISGLGPISTVFKREVTGHPLGVVESNTAFGTAPHFAALERVLKPRLLEEVTNRKVERHHVDPATGRRVFLAVPVDDCL